MTSITLINLLFLGGWAAYIYKTEILRDIFAALFAMVVLIITYKRVTKKDKRR